MNLREITDSFDVIKGDSQVLLHLRDLNEIVRDLEPSKLLDDV